MLVNLMNPMFGICDDSVHCLDLHGFGVVFVMILTQCSEVQMGCCPLSMGAPNLTLNTGIINAAATDSLTEGNIAYHILKHIP